MTGEKKKETPALGDGGRPRSLVALLTDFGVSGFYVGAMKAALLAADPGAAVVDLTHGVRPFAVSEASFILSVVFEYWAPGTVFLAVVDPGVGGERRNIVVCSKDRAVVCPDNGIVSDIASRFGVERAYAIDDGAVASIRKHEPQGRTFLGRDILAPVAAFLAAGGNAESVAAPIDDIRRLTLPQVEVREGYIRGEIRHVDDYGNCLTNISGDDLTAAFGHAPRERVRASINGAILVDGVRECFADGAPGELAVILDSWNLIEIAAREARAADRFAPRRPIVVELTRG